MRKVFNTIFVKNIPKSHDSEEGIRSLFGPFGRVESVFAKASEKGNIYFICYGSENAEDRESGPRSAEKACQEMNGKLLPGTDTPIYVNGAMNKKERIQTIQKESNRFKISKRRCNLYVRNFPANTSEDDLVKLFRPYGEIESVRLIAP